MTRSGALRRLRPFGYAPCTLGPVTMESVGEFLSRIGPAFAVVLFFLVVTSSVTLVLMSVIRLAKPNGEERPAAEAVEEQERAETGAPSPSEAPAAATPSHA